MTSVGSQPRGRDTLSPSWASDCFLRPPREHCGRRIWGRHTLGTQTFGGWWGRQEAGGTARTSAHTYRTTCGSHCCSRGNRTTAAPGAVAHRAGAAVGGRRAVPSALDPHTRLLDLWDEGSSGPQPRPGVPTEAWGPSALMAPQGCGWYGRRGAIENLFTTRATEISTPICSGQMSSAQSFRSIAPVGPCSWVQVWLCW